MAKKKSNKSLSTINAILKSELQDIRSRGQYSLEDRISALEKELRDSMTIAMSMIAVNKELINRVEENQQTLTRVPGENISQKDTSADILGKLYNFFVKGSEEDKKRYEIQRDFAQERAMESKKRKSYAKRPSASKANLNKPSSNPLLDLLGFVGKGLGSILGFLTGGLFGLISKGLGSIKNTFMSIPGMGMLGGILSFFATIGKKGIGLLFDLVGFAGTAAWKTIKAGWWIIKGILDGSRKIGEFLGELLWDNVLKDKFEKGAVRSEEHTSELQSH